MKIKFLTIALFLFMGTKLMAQQPKILPQFTFYTLDGKAFSTKDVDRTKKSLLMLFDCTCEHCQRETKLLFSNYGAFKGVNIYMITLDEVFAIQQFFGSYAPGLNLKPNVKVLQDKKKIFIPTFLPDQYPAIYLYSEGGKLLEYSTGDGGMKKMLKALKK